ncbi:zinc finger B-box domain-containing protein 1 isoform X2 [Hemicordylus capensis]|uniref:zinc finger B-box domain-containing protein 1 isoform X2 n=1 Tax=Hemicordylus capensis TaxID=884348 RepID=UPI002302A5A8|nr:zinc finger B-box domain-containing protein 1 isoform X2 [Hemicordylus capensis]
MNVNDFVILPGSKTGLSVKLKEKSVRELQLQKVQLELENKEMEKKLQQLQSNMSREKQERERANGYHWRSGQSGLSPPIQLLSQNKENVGKISSGKVKLRLLKEQVQAPEPAKQPLTHKAANTASTEKPRVKGKVCGQCETKAALLVCLECGEDYCPSCFARVHQKGALKLHRTTSLQAKVHIPVGKLEAAQRFLKRINVDKFNGQMNNEQAEMNSMLKDSLDTALPLPEMPMYDTEIEKTSTVPTEVWPESQIGCLLHGTYDEEESAKSFQEALNQWRSGSPSLKLKEERACQVGSENIGTSEAQTSPPILKKNIDIEFKEDSLKYMERLLLKKHRRTPVDKLPDVVIEGELNLEKPLTNETPDSWVREEEEEEEDDDEIATARLEAEEMKKCWVVIARPEEPGAVFVNSEPSFQIKILDNDCKEELEESVNFVVMEAGSDEFLDDHSGTMSENLKNGPDIFLAQAGDFTSRSPLSSSVEKENGLTFLHNKREETPRANISSMQPERTGTLCSHSGVEEMVPNTPYERAVMKEKSTKTQNNSTLLSSEQTSRLPELPPSEPFPMMELLKDCKISLELNEAAPVTTKSSVLLQEVALRKKIVCAPYRGLEGFFTMDASSQQAVMDSLPSPCMGRQSASNDTSFSESASPRSFPTTIPCCRTIQHSPRPSPVLQRGPTSPVSGPLSRAASEISEIEGIDVTEHDDPLLEYSTDEQALTDLESELQSNADPLEKFNGLTSGDLSAFTRHSKMTSQNLTDLHNHEINDYSSVDTIRVYDESHTDDEEDLLRDKQQVIELQ